MSRMVLISCAKLKLPQKAKVRDLYISTLFKKSLIYAQHCLQPDKIFVLSAKHGLLDLDTEIEPYDVTLNNMSVKERRGWADKVLQQLQVQADLANDTFIFLASNRYTQFLMPRIAHYELPMRGLGIGKQLSLLNDRLIAEGLVVAKRSTTKTNTTEADITDIKTEIMEMESLAEKVAETEVVETTEITESTGVTESVDLAHTTVHTEVEGKTAAEGNTEPVEGKVVESQTSLESTVSSSPDHLTRN